MSREPIRLGPSTYTGPMTMNDILAWFDQMFADEARVLHTNLLEAIAAGELTDIDALDGIDATLELAARVAAAGREQVRRFLLDFMEKH